MNGMLALLREAVATARSQRVASLVSIIMIAGVCAAVLLTTGRSVGAEQDVLASIDSSGTRSIVVRAEPAAGVDSSVLTRIEDVRGIEWVAAFGPATDVTNEALPSGLNVPARRIYAADPTKAGLPGRSEPDGSSAWVSAKARDALGMVDAAGSVVDGDGRAMVVRGDLRPPENLSFLEPLVVSPAPIEETGAVSVIVVVATRPELVAPLSKVVSSVIAPDDPSGVTVTTSESLATLRALVQGQLGAFGRELALLVFAVTGLLTSVILYGLVMMRRKDFGRRRALGATRGLIVALLLAQMVIVSVIGAVLGTGVATAVLIAGHVPIPGPAFILSVVVLAVFVGVVSALVPAVAASRRDPLRELRVP